MCFNEPVSWVTLIVGTIVNILSIIYLVHSGKPNIILPIIIVVVWQYGLLMQVADALSWRNPTSTNPGKLAFILNITQPIIYFIGVCIIFYILKIPIIRLVPAIILCIIYIIYIFRAISHIDFKLKFDNCSNLQYTWWKQIPAITYILLMLSILLSIPSIPLIIVNIILFLGTLLISKLLVNKQCSPGSLWCWSVALSGLVVTLTWKYTNNV